MVISQYCDTMNNDEDEDDEESNCVSKELRSLWQSQAAWTFI